LRLYKKTNCIDSGGNITSRIVKKIDLSKFALNNDNSQRNLSSFARASSKSQNKNISKFSIPCKNIKELIKNSSEWKKFI
jgi:hypothetical protein